METVTLDVIKVDSTKIVLSDGNTKYESDLSQGDKEVIVGDKVIASFNKDRLWFWVYWLGNYTPSGMNSVMLPNRFIANVMGYRDGMCLMKVNRDYYWIPAYCRVPSGLHKVKVTCRSESMKVSRWKVESTSVADVKAGNDERAS